MGEHAADASGIDFASQGKGGETGFEGEGVGFEPGEERRVTEDASVRKLRGVDVSV